MSNLKRTALASAMASVLVLGAATTAYSETTDTTDYLNTSTKSGVFTVDAMTVKAGSKVNLSINGLNATGEVDTQGEQKGSTIVAMVTSSKGEVECPGESGTLPTACFFEADVTGGTTRYVKLVAGLGRVNISYPVEAGGSTDTINITLQEVFDNKAGGTTVNVIDSTQKIINIDYADLDVALLDITEFTGGINEDKDAANGGIDGITTAGKEGAQVKVVAYKDIKIDYAMGTPDTPEVSGSITNKAVNGILTLVLRPKSSESVGGNTATESITLTGNMSKGEATVSIPTEVTEAAKYYMEATLEGYEGLSSVDMYNDDTLEVNPVLKAKKVGLYSEKTTISDNADAISGTQLKACMLDQYGNKTEAGNSLTVNLKDATEHVSNTAISFLFSATDVCVSNSTTILGDVIDEALEFGTAEMIAHIKNQTAIADSDVVSLKIVPDQLVASILFTGKAPVQAGVSITKNVLGINAFQVNKDDGNVVNTGGPTTMEIRHMYNGWQLEKTEGTIGQDTDQLGARFDKSSSDSATGSSYKNEYYVLATTEGTYGEVVVQAALSVPDIIPASPSKHKMVDGHGQEITSIKATKVKDSDPVEYRALVRENSVKMEDALGNETSPSLSVDLLSSNGTVENGDLNANETAGNMSSVTYDPISFVGGDDLVQFVFKEPKLTGSDLTVEVPVNQELEEIKLEVESDKIPVNGMVPVRVTSWDQFGELYAHSKGVFLEIDAGSEVAVRVYYVDKENGQEEGPIANNTLINNSKVNDRSVLAVYALNGTTGSFTLNVRDADNAITASQTFEITRKFEDFTVDPTEVTVISGDTTEVTLAGGSAPCTAVPADEDEDEAVATVTVNEDCTAATITGVSAEEAETTITVTDADNRIVTIAVKVIAPATQEECEGEGNVYVDGECQALPSTNNSAVGGQAGVMTSAGITFTSNAQFSGGWSLDGGPYSASAINGGEELTLSVIIRFDPAHVGEEVDIVVPLMILLDPPFSPYPPFWFQYSWEYGFVTWDMTTGAFNEATGAGLDAIMEIPHEIVADEPLVLGPYEFGKLPADFPSSIVDFYFGYRLDNGETHFGVIPVKLTTP